MRHLLLFLLLVPSFVEAQDYTIRQDKFGEERAVEFEMLDVTDGYTPETGLSPTCTVKKPLGTSFSSSVNSPSEIGSGKYQLVLDYAEVQNLGTISVYCTGSGARPMHKSGQVIQSGSMIADGTTYLPAPSNYNNTTYWTKTGSTVTEDSSTDYLSRTIADTLTGDGASTAHQVAKNTVKPEGSGWFYFSTEVKSGSLNNAWVGDSAWLGGGDFNTSTGVFAPTAFSYIKGWKVDKLANSWWRVHILYSGIPSDSTYLLPTVALGNGTPGSGPPSFATSGTMLFARTVLARAEDVTPVLFAELLPNLQTASSTSSLTLALHETTSSNFYNNREICFQLGYSSSNYAKVQKTCSCISAYDGSTKIVTLATSLSGTLNSEYKYRIGGFCTTNVNVSSMSAGVVTNSAIATNAIDNSKLSDNTIGALEIASDAITEPKIAAGAITSSEFAQSAADKVWNTAPQDGSASTALGYLDAIKKYVANKMTIVGSDYEIFKDDQTTSYATGTTNSAGRDPD